MVYTDTTLNTKVNTIKTDLDKAKALLIIGVGAGLSSAMEWLCEMYT
jgi:hypothetical protein